MSSCSGSAGPDAGPFPWWNATPNQPRVAVPGWFDSSGEGGAWNEGGGAFWAFRTALGNGGYSCWVCQKQVHMSAAEHEKRKAHVKYVRQLQWHEYRDGAVQSATEYIERNGLLEKQRVQASMLVPWVADMDTESPFLMNVEMAKRLCEWIGVGGPNLSQTTTRALLGLAVPKTPQQPDLPPPPGLLAVASRDLLTTDPPDSSFKDASDSDPGAASGEQGAAGAGGDGLRGEEKVKPSKRPKPVGVEPAPAQAAQAAKRASVAKPSRKLFSKAIPHDGPATASTIRSRSRSPFRPAPSSSRLLSTQSQSSARPSRSAKSQMRNESKSTPQPGPVSQASAAPQPRRHPLKPKVPPHGIGAKRSDQSRGHVGD